MQKRLSLICRPIQSFTQTDILSLLPESTLREIKAVDPHPFFQMYSICHEGESSPRVLDGESKPISWGRRAIQSIKNIITKGIKFFRGHNADNSTVGRPELGEVVHSFEKEIDGQLHHVVIGYYPPETREEVKKYDVCSQEAEWNLFDEASHFVAEKITQLTGIALADGNEEAPAFKGARRLGMVQAFEPGKGNDTPPDSGTEPGKGEKDMNFAEWKQWGIDHNVHPSQMYSVEQIQADKNFSKVFSENEQLKQENAAKDEQLKTLQEENKTVKIEYQKSTAKDRLNEIIKSNVVPMTDEIKSYIAKRSADDLTTMQDFSDEQLTNYVQTSVNNYQWHVKNSSLFLKDGKQELPQGGQETPPADKEDATKAANNPLLEEDYETDT